MLHNDSVFALKNLFILPAVSACCVEVELLLFVVVVGGGLIVEHAAVLSR